jgi:hypothetical protein
MELRMRIWVISKILKTVVKRASPPVDACEGPSYDSFHSICVTFSRPMGRYVINTCYVLSNIASVSYCYSTCELIILVTHMYEGNQAWLTHPRSHSSHAEYVGTRFRQSSCSYTLKLQGPIKIDGPIFQLSFFGRCLSFCPLDHEVA